MDAVANAFSKYVLTRTELNSKHRLKRRPKADSVGRSPDRIAVTEQLTIRALISSGIVGVVTTGVHDNRVLLEFTKIATLQNTEEALGIDAPNISRCNRA